MTDNEAVMTLLRKIPLFAKLKDEDKVCIEETEEWRLAAGEMLVKEGEPAEHFFVLLEGEISVWRKHVGQDVVVARNRPGAFFGEVPLLLGTPLYALRTRRTRLQAHRLSGGVVLEAVAALPGDFGRDFPRDGDASSQHRGFGATARKA